MAWLTGWSYRKPLPIPSSGWGLSADVSDFTIEIPVTSALTAFWAAVKSDGGDVRFTSSDGTTLLKKVTVKFDSTGDSALYVVKIPTVAAASDPTIYLYAGNASATTDDDNANAFKSTVRAWFAHDENYSGGAFVDLKNGLSGTNNGTTDAADQLSPGRGRAVSAITPNDISVTDNDLLSFGNGTTDTDMSIVSRAKMTDATRFRICSKGNTASSDAEYHWVVTGADTIAFYASDKTPSAGYCNRNTTDTVTADEGSWVRLAVTKTGTTINLYRNASLMAMGSPNISSYTAMENLAAPLYIGSYYHTADITGSGDIGELIFIAEVITTDWMKCYEYSSSGSWISWGADEYIASLTDTGTGTDAISVDIGSSTIAIADTGAGADDITSIIAAITLGDTGAGSDAILVYSGDLHSITETGTGLDSLVSLAASLAISESASGADSIYISGIVTPDVILESAHGFGAGYEGQTEYKVVDEYRQIIEDWTAAGVFEVPEDGTTSSYSVKIGRLSQYTIFWRISGTRYKARRTVNLFESNNDAQTSSRLAAADFIAPDNAGIATLPLLSEIEGSSILAKEATLAEVLTIVTLLKKYARNKRVIWKDPATGIKYLIIYDDNGTTELVRKALKDPTATNIADLITGSLATEEASSV